MGARPCTYSRILGAGVEGRPWHPDEGEAVEAVVDMDLPKDSRYPCMGRVVSCVEGEAAEVACGFVRVQYRLRPATTEEAQLSVDAWMEVGKRDKGTRERGGRGGHQQKQI